MCVRTSKEASVAGAEWARGVIEARERRAWEWAAGASSCINL